MVWSLRSIVSLHYRLSENLEAHNFVLHNYPNKRTNEKDKCQRTKKRKERAQRRSQKERVNERSARGKKITAKEEKKVNRKREKETLKVGM